MQCPNPPFAPYLAGATTVCEADTTFGKMRISFAFLLATLPYLAVAVSFSERVWERVLMCGDYRTMRGVRSSSSR